MFCQNCGKTIPDGSKFCPYCGALTPVEHQPAAPSQPVREQPFNQQPSYQPQPNPQPTYQQTPAYQQPGPQNTYPQPNQPPYSQPNQQPYSQPSYSQPYGGGQSTYGMQPVGPNSYSYNGKKPKTWLIILIVAIAVVALIVVLFGLVLNGRSSKKQTIDLDKYVEVDFEGSDGSGYIEADFDYDALEEDFGDRVTMTKEGKDQLGNCALSDYLYNLTGDYFYIEFDKDSDLSNGDEVSYSWTVDESIEEFYNVELVYDGQTLTVKGLD